MRGPCKTCMRGKTECLYTPIATQSRTTMKLELTYRLLCNSCACKSVNGGCNKKIGGCKNWIGPLENPEEEKE